MADVTKRDDDEGETDVEDDPHVAGSRAGKEDDDGTYVCM